MSDNKLDENSVLNRVVLVDVKTIMLLRGYLFDLEGCLWEEHRGWMGHPSHGSYIVEKIERLRQLRRSMLEITGLPERCSKEDKSDV